MIAYPELRLVYADFKLNRINRENSLGLASDDQTGVGLIYQY